MDDKIRCGYLYDFYGELLNDHQKSIMEDYFYNDLSLSEIASSNGVSRQGVHDLIKRCTKSLEDYEAKLHLLERFLSVKQKINHINDMVSNADKSELNSEIIRISNEILEEL